MLTVRILPYLAGDGDAKLVMAGNFGTWMTLLAVRETGSQFDQAESCSLLKLTCCCCNIAFDDNCHVAFVWCVLEVEYMFDKLSNVTREDIGNYCTS